MKNLNLIVGAALLGAGAALAHAADASDASAQAALRVEMRDVLSRLVAAGALDGTAPLEVEAPPDRVLTLGVVLDAAPGRGPQVLAVTPGGNAEALGLRSGDRLLAVNGVALDGGGAEAVRAQALRADGGLTRFEIERGGKQLVVEGRLRPLQVPGFKLTVGGTGVAGGATRALAASLPAAGAGAPGGCGRISHFEVAPRSEKLYRAKIIAIDGHIPGPSNAQSFRVDAGRHEVTLAEDIDYRQLPMVYSRNRRNNEKTFSVEVAADTTLLLAAKLILPGNQAGGDYWEPVVWKAVPEPCR